MSSPDTSTPNPPPISDAQLRAIEQADQRERSFAFALKLARANGVGLAVCAVLALLSDLLEPSSWLLAGVLALLAYFELRGRRQLAAFDRRGLFTLTMNQLALVAFVCIYAVSRILSARSGQNPLAELMQQSGELSQLVGAQDDAGGDAGGLDELVRTGVTAFYALVIALTVVCQGGCALYYWTRRKHLDDFNAQTPAWVIAWKRGRRPDA